MQRDELGDLLAFLAVAEEESFTKAAARLGTSQSSLSLILKRLEARLGVRLLTRTTRSVAPTAAGEQLFSTLAPAFGTIEAQLSALSEFRDSRRGASGSPPASMRSTRSFGQSFPHSSSIIPISRSSSSPSQR